LPDLERLTDRVDAICADYLGETITYVPTGRAHRRFKAHVYYSDGQRDIGAGQMIDQEMMLHIRKVDLPFTPNRNDRIVLPRRQGKVYFPTSPSTDDSGTHWVVNLKVVT
jgi:hypothetical protein